MIIHVQQGSPAWHEWRLGGVTGTDAPVILDCHRRRPGAIVQYKALLGEKLAPPPPDDRYPEHWRRRGPTDAIAGLARRVGFGLEPACCQHDSEPWLRATLQGLTWLGDAVALAEKNVIARHEMALAGELPEGVEAQAQHCLLASGAGLCWYASWSDAKRFAEGERFAVVEILEDPELLVELVEAEREFWNRVLAARSGGRWAQESA